MGSRARIESGTVSVALRGVGMGDPWLAHGPRGPVSTVVGG
jgi:hypothetical protein